MKKILSLTIAAILVVSMLGVIPFGVFAKEDAPESTAISDAAGFSAMTPNGIYYLTADITVSETYMSEFTGSFDGKGHKITTSVPLFETFSGTGSNLVIEGAVTVTRSRGGVFANTLGGATLTKIINKASLTAPTKEVSLEAGDALELNGVYGGIAGTSNKQCTLTVKDCANYGKIIGYNAGGLFGKNHAQIVFSGLENYGDVVGTDCGGGIVGWEYGDGSLEKVLNKGTITSVTEYAGGIISYVSSNTEITVKDGVNYGNCTAENSGAGGIIGRAGNKDTLTFENCINYGKITGNGEYAGGINGSVRGIFNAKNCFNYGDVSALKQAGGMCANMGSDDVNGLATIEHCGNEAKITAKNDTAGGIIGYTLGAPEKPVHIYYCYNTGDVNGGCEASGILGYSNKLTTLEVKYCYNMGKIATTDTNEKSLALYYNKDANLLPDGAVVGNYYIKDCAQNEAKLNYNTYSDLTSTLTAADFASGKVCYMLNQAAGKEVYFQTIGKDAFPKLSETSKSVKFDGSKYFNEAAPATGDGFVWMAAVAVVAVLGMGISLKAKKN